MTTENVKPFVSAHPDPENESPWAMQLVVNENHLATPLELAHATSHAVLEYLATATVDPARGAAVTRWMEGRIRKILRRAKNARWEALEAEDGLTTTTGNVSVRVFTPCSMDEIPKNISRCQVSNLKTADEKQAEIADEVEAYSPPLTIFQNRSLGMSPAKAAIAAAHVAHLVSDRMDDEVYAEWKSKGFPLAVSTLGEISNAVADSATVAIRDAGLTEVVPGSVTAIGFFDLKLL